MIAMPLSAKDIPLPAPPIVPSVYEQISPQVATDGRDYLAVWSRDGVRAARISPSGTLIDTESFVISDQPSGLVRIAWIGTAYLVVYGGWYALVSGNGEVLQRDVRLLPVTYVDLTRVVWNGRDVLISWAEPTGRTAIPFLSLFDSNLQVIRARIDLNAFSTVATKDGFVAFSKSASGAVLATPIVNDGTVQPATTVSGISGAATAASDGSNIVIAWADSAVHTMNFANHIVHDVNSAFPQDLNIIGGRSGFLLTWTKNGVFGIRLNHDGEPIDAAPFPVSRAPFATAFQGVSNGDSHFLIWSDGRRSPFATGQVWGAYIPVSRPDVGREFPIAFSPADQFAPNVVFHGAIGLIAWGETTVDKPSRVVVTRFAADGTILDPRGIEVTPAGVPSGIATDGRDFLVVWRDPVKWYDYKLPVRAALVRADGSVAPIQTLASEEGYSSPHVAFDGQNYFVVWDDGAGDESRRVHGARVNRDGYLIDPIRFDFGHGFTPTIGFDGIDYWLVYSQLGSPPLYRRPVLARRITRVGFPIEGDPLVLDATGDSPASPEIACNADRCLAIWFHLGYSSLDLSAAVLDSNGVVASSFPIAKPGVLGVGLSAVATTKVDFFVTWAAWGGADSDVQGARVSRSGAVLGLVNVATTGVNAYVSAPVAINDKLAIVYERGGISGSERFHNRLILRTEIAESRRRAVD